MFSIPFLLPRITSFCHFLLSGFVSHQAIARTAGNVLIRLADSLVLPLNCSDYAESLEDYVNTAVKLYEEQLKTKNISMGKGRDRFRVLTDAQKVL